MGPPTACFPPLWQLCSCVRCAHVCGPVGEEGWPLVVGSFFLLGCVVSLPWWTLLWVPTQNTKIFTLTTHSQSATRRPACPQPPNLSFSRPLTYELSHSRLLRVHICSNLRPLLLPKTDGQRVRYLKVFSVGGILSPCLSGPPLSAQGLYCSNRPFLGSAM